MKLARICSRIDRQYLKGERKIANEEKGLIYIENAILKGFELQQRRKIIVIVKLKRLCGFDNFSPEKTCFVLYEEWKRRNASNISETHKLY